MIKTKRCLLANVITATLIFSGNVFALNLSPRDLAEVTVMPANNAENVNVTLNVADGRDYVRINDNIAFCFSVNQPGYISLWDIGTSGKVSRIYPFTGQDEQEVRANQKRCVGENTGNTHFKVVGPTGTENVVAYWTKDREAQLEAANYKNAQDFIEQFEKSAKDAVRNGSWENWATAKVSFEIIGENATAPDPLANLGDFVQTNSQYNNVYVIAFGSNVDGLKKTNDDAKMFTKIAQDTFNIPSNNIRLYENAYRSDFEKGFEWVGNQAGSNDLVLFYYSGHGTRIPDDNNDEADGYDEALVPYDIENKENYNRADKYIRDDELREWFSRINAGAVVSLFDSCFSGGMYKSFSQGDLLNARSKFFSKGNLAGKLPQFKGGRSKGSGRARDVIIDGLDNLGNGNTKYIMISASQEDEYALELEALGGMFTLGLHDALQKGQQSRSWAEMTDLLSRNISRQSRGRQTPVTIDPDNVLKNFKLN